MIVRICRKYPIIAAIRASSAWSLAAAFVATAPTGPASAQGLGESGDNSPPVLQMLDPNGVNVWSSDVSYPMQSLNIGPQDIALGVNVQWSGPSFGHSHQCYATNWKYVGEGGKRSGSDIGIQVVCGGSSTQFLSPGVGVGGVDNSNGTGYLNAATNGADETLVKTIAPNGTFEFLYTDRNGVRTLFKIPSNANYNPPSGNGQIEEWVYAGLITVLDPIYLAESTTFPNGVILRYTYNFYEWSRTNLGSTTNSRFFVLQSVNSNSGFQLKFQYPANINLASTDDTVNYWAGNWGTFITPDSYTYTMAMLNGAREYCAPISTSCTFANQWPTGVISTFRSTSPANGVTNITSTDSLGHMSQYNVSIAPFIDPFWGATPQVLNSIVSPSGMDNVSIQRTFFNAPTTIIRNGVVTNYTWQNRPNSGTCNQYGCPVLAASSTQQVSVNIGGIVARQFNTAGNIPTLTVAKSYMTSVIDGNWAITSYSLGCRGIPGTTQYPEGNRTEFTFDGRCNILAQTEVPKPGSGDASLVSSANFDVTCTLPSKCNQPNWTRDANGNQTDFTYTSWGARQSEMGPAPSPGSARPLVLYTYRQIAANILNASGALVSTGEPIWTPDTETQCQTVAGSSALSCDPAALQVTKTYLYGAQNAADNLWVRGQQVASGGVTLTTCFGYDSWGRKISETAPNANLTTCP